MALSILHVITLALATSKEAGPTTLVHRQNQRPRGVIPARPRLHSRARWSHPGAQVARPAHESRVPGLQQASRNWAGESKGIMPGARGGGRTWLGFQSPGGPTPQTRGGPELSSGRGVVRVSLTEPERVGHETAPSSGLSSSEEAAGGRGDLRDAGVGSRVPRDDKERSILDRAGCGPADRASFCTGFLCCRAGG